MSNRDVWSLSRSARSLLGLVVVAVVYTPDAYAESGHGNAPAPGKSFHPSIRLLDREGQNVLVSGRAVSTDRTCGACHDVRYIGDHCYHADLGLRAWFRPGQSEMAIHPWDFTGGGIGQWNPLFYRRLSPPGDEKPDLGLADWLRLYGFRYVGGFAGRYGFGNSELTERQLGGSDALQDGAEAARASAEPSRADPRTSWDPDLFSTGGGSAAPQIWDWRQSGTLEMNCFLCHLSRPDNAMRVEEIKAGRFGWATTATLAGTGLVSRADSGWTYHAEAFDKDGYVNTENFRLVRPTAKHCGQCHGKVVASDDELSCLEITFSDYSTLTKGQIFSGEKICESALNLENKKEVTRPWDVHAAALLECRHCHFSLDNPGLVDPPARGRPSHLRYEPRRLSFGEYLERPSHQFAKGDTAQGRIAPEFSNSMRTCRDCHDVENTHHWLPFKAVHMARLECETCHIPKVYAPALRSVDWTAPFGERPFVQWRGLDYAAGGLAVLRGFRPAILPRKRLDGQVRLGPFNLIRVMYWVEQGPTPRPVRLVDLQKVLPPAGANRGIGPDATGFWAFSNPAQQPGRVVASELAAKLSKAGVNSPRLIAELWPFGLHHGVAPANMAIHRCETCHSRSSILGATVSLGDAAAELPPNNVELIKGTGIVEAFSIESTAEKSEYHLRPIPEKAGFYILGKSRFILIDLSGALALVGVMGAIATHGILRIWICVLGRRARDRGCDEEK